jgi:hypothetical protein
MFTIPTNEDLITSMKQELKEAGYKQRTHYKIEKCNAWTYYVWVQDINLSISEFLQITGKYNYRFDSGVSDETSPRKDFYGINNSSFLRVITRYSDSLVNDYIKTHSQTLNDLIANQNSDTLEGFTGRDNDIKRCTNDYLSIKTGLPESFIYYVRERNCKLSS